MSFPSYWYIKTKYLFSGTLAAANCCRYQIFNLNRLRISPLSLVWPIEHSLYLATYVELQLCERAKKFVKANLNQNRQVAIWPISPELHKKVSKNYSDINVNKTAYDEDTSCYIYNDLGEATASEFWQEYIKGKRYKDTWR